MDRLGGEVDGGAGLVAEGEGAVRVGGVNGEVVSPGAGWAARFQEMKPNTATRATTTTTATVTVIATGTRLRRG